MHRHRRLLAGGLAILIGCAAPSEASSPDEPAAPAAREAAPPADRPPPSAAHLPPAESLRSALDRARGATVSIESWAPYLGWHRVGSGVAVSSDGLVLTAAHVVEADGRYRVGGADRPLRVRWRDAGADLALVAGGAATEAPLPLASAPPAEGEWVICAGFPGRAAADPRARATVGRVTAVDTTWFVRVPDDNGEPDMIDPSKRFRREGREHMLRTTCASAPGMSGGPVMRLDGALLAVHAATGGIAAPASALDPTARVDLPDPLRRGDAPEADPTPLGELLARALGDMTGARASVVRLEPVDRDIDALGVVVAPHLVLTSSLAAAGGAPRARALDADPSSAGSATEVVEIDSELALLEVRGERLTPITGGAGLAVGRVVVAIGATPSAGFITDVDRAPGRVDAPPFGRVGCGWLRGHARRTQPAVELGRVLTHDAPVAERGALLVDRGGQPLAIHVGQAGPGLGYAVPLDDAYRRFSGLRARAAAP